jgi:ribosomal protein L29
MILESFDFHQLNQLSVKELKALVEEEKKGVEELRGQIKSKMLKISAAMKKYDISTGNVNAHIKFEKGDNVKM